jgi:regulator of protease activity HflC (stomatin/prohibitin superfamily)
LEIGPDFYPNIVKPEFLTVVRNTVADYAMVEIPEKSPEIEAKILQALRDRVKGKHIELDNVTINHIDFTAGMLRAIETKLAKEQERTQKDFELDIAVKEAEIARVRAKSEADALQIRANGEAEAQKVRAAGQAEAQKSIDRTLTPRFLQFKAFDSSNTKFIYVPIGKDGLPIIVSPEGR